jgi:hypothetical protein
VDCGLWVHKGTSEKAVTYVCCLPGAMSNGAYFGILFSEPK